jgi:glycosyltransferase involved in cell wall biosynthesis
MPGLFIQRQAEALAKEHTVRVISVHPDPHCKNKYEVVHSVENSVNVCRVYYREEKKLSAMSVFINFFRYVKAHHLGYTSLGRFSVDIVHGHILTREIFFTWYMARKQKRPFIISEHWSRYFPGNGSYRGFLRRRMSSFLLRRSAGLIAVSEPLLHAMRAEKLSHPKSYIVPNVIDVSAFIPPPDKPVRDRALILHVSCFEDKSKNISGFLEAVSELYKHRQDFSVLLVGEGPDQQVMQNYAQDLGLNEVQLEFAGLKQGDELISLYQSASFLVQSSHYETFGTVVIEAMACGLPVVSTNTGIAASIINDSNGIIIQQGGVGEIVKCMKQMLNIYPTFDWIKLHEAVADRFSGKKISEELIGIYNEIISTWQKD